MVGSAVGYGLVLRGGTVGWFRFGVGLDSVVGLLLGSAVTDTGESGNTMSPGVENLFSVLKASGSLELHREFLAQYDSKTIKYADLKDAVSEGLIKLSNHFTERKLEVEANKKEIKYKIKASSARIRSIAQETVKEVKELTGLANIKF